MSFLNESDRRTVLDKVVQTTEREFADPRLNGVDFRELARESEASIINSVSADEFETNINALLQKLGTSHVGFFQGTKPKSPGRIAIAATFIKAETTDGSRWVFQDVHPGGVAAKAGLQPGDILLTLDGQEVLPPAAASFSLGQQHAVTVRRNGGSTVQSLLDVPTSREKKRPLVVPDQVVTARKVAPNVGVVRVSMFPGIVGMDVARDINRALEELDCGSLIIDLRGNTGGGIGCLRLMSIMCVGTQGVGYSVGRRLLEKGYSKERLPRFDRIPDSKLGVVPLLFRFGLAGRSIAVFTEGLGARKYHGRVVVLVNEHSASASEMVAAFASENKLATLVGVKTPGRLVAASSFKVGFGYRIALPVAAYFTWQGTKLEGRGVAVDVETPVSLPALLNGEDNQFQSALRLFT